MVMSFIFLCTSFNTVLIFAIFQCYTSKTCLCYEFRLIANKYNRQNFNLLLLSFQFFIFFYVEMFIHVDTCMHKHAYVAWGLYTDQKATILVPLLLL